MNIRDMEYIAAVAEHGSITAAAKALFITQPSLTQCLQKVERELGGPVFTRSASGVTLTDEGACFVQYAHEVLRQKRTFERQVQDIRGGGAGRVVLGFTGAQAPLVIPYVFSAFHKRYPGISLHLAEGASGAIEEMLLSHRIDIGILHPPVLHDGLDYFELSSDRMVVLPRPESDYQKYVFIKEETGQSYIDLRFFETEKLAMTTAQQRSRLICDEIFRRAGVVPKIGALTAYISTLDTMARIGYASAIVPQKQVSAENVRRGVYFIDEQYSVPYSFVAAVAKDAYMPVAVRRLWNVLHELRGTF